MDPDDSDLAVAILLADAADRVSSRGHASRSGRQKSDGSLVTDTDVQIEENLLSIIRERRPLDGFVGEEAGRHEGAGPRSWFVDGIDGTAAFVEGRPEWSTLIALLPTQDADPSVGVCTSPQLNARWWAEARSTAWCSRDGGPPHPMRVSTTTTLTPDRIARWPPVLGDSSARRPSQGTGHPNGALLVAAGMVDAFILTGGGPWDIAAVAVIVESAGGRWSDGEGGRRLDRDVVVFSNGAVHDAVLDSLSGSGSGEASPMPS